MTLAQLSERAFEIRQQFDALGRARNGRGWTPEEVMQGFVVDVGHLTRLVMAKSGIREVDNLETKLPHELADCLWSVLVLSRLYDVDLEQAFLRTMDELEAKLTAELQKPSSATAPDAG